MMLNAYAGRICCSHVRTAYARTDERTNKDEEITHVPFRPSVSERARGQAK